MSLVAAVAVALAAFGVLTWTGPATTVSAAEVLDRANQASSGAAVLAELIESGAQVWSLISVNGKQPAARRYAVLRHCIERVSLGAWPILGSTALLSAAQM